MILETILGGLTGLLGNVFTAWTNYKSQQLKNNHDLAMYDFKIKEISAKTDAAVKINAAKISGEVELADSNAYIESQKQGNKDSFSDSWIEKLFSITGWLSYITIPVACLLATLLGIVDVLKGLMRPGITLYLTAVTSWITYQAYEVLKQSDMVITATQALDLYSNVTSIVIYLTVTCVTWWFGDRRMAKFLTNLNGGKTTE
jgi:hypothetical protein